jgi:rhamnosyltransferase
MMEPADHSGTQRGAEATLPRVLILLAAYNGADSIREQIASILRQAAVEVHLVVQDDCSTDSTIALVREFATVDSRVQLLVADAPSGSASQNFFSLIRSCDAAGFSFVALSDQDDIWNPDKIHRATEMLTRTQSDGYSSAVTAVWPTGKSRILRQNSGMTESDYLLEGAGQGCTFVLSASLYAQLRSALTIHEPLTRRIHFHDWAIYALSRVWNLNWAFDPYPTMIYRQHGGNDIGARSGLRGALKRLMQIREGWYLRQLLEISTLSHAVSRTNSIIACWHKSLRADKNWRRRATIVRLCLRGGRRRRQDNIILIMSVLLGWV